MAGIGEAAAQAHNQPKRLRYAMGLSMVAPNVEVEGPSADLDRAPCAHNNPARIARHISSHGRSKRWLDALTQTSQFGMRLKKNANNRDQEPQD